MNKNYIIRTKNGNRIVSYNDIKMEVRKMENTRKAEIIKAIRFYDNKGLPEAVKIYNTLPESEKQAYYMRYDRYKSTLIDRRTKK